MMGRDLNIGRTAGELTNDRWLTPLPIITALGRFDLDPCGAPGHPTADEVWIPETIGDGLSMPWHGRVWMNPPYGAVMSAWMRRLAEHGRGTALVFARTETALFHEVVWPLATAILFMRGMVTFLTPDGTPGPANSGAPSVLIAYGDQDARALESSGLGHVLWNRQHEAVS